MLAKLHLENFKNFKDAELHLGPFTLLVGENASGKSNIRDALRFLHGIARGYNVAEVFGEVWGEGGVLQWKGIRGGTREAAFADKFSFLLTLSLEIEIDSKQEKQELSYELEIDFDTNRFSASIISEILITENSGELIFCMEDEEEMTDRKNLASYSIFCDRKGLEKAIRLLFYDSKKFIEIDPGRALAFFGNASTILRGLGELRIFEDEELNKRMQILESIKNARQILQAIRFFDFNPDAMRSPSFPGQAILGDRGENLSSVLYEICQDEQQKAILVSWLKKLTPMDVVDLDFHFEYSGKVLLLLKEKSGEKISAYSASDGTLRFLGFLAAMLNPKEANKIAFFEELENGIHPTRLYLLVQLIEQTAAKNNTQVIATTHSPQLLRMLNEVSLESASLVYRLPDRKDAKIKRIVDIPDARRIIEKKDLGDLQETGWLETAVYFTEDEEE